MSGFDDVMVGVGANVETTHAFSRKMLGSEVDEGDSHCLPQLSCSPALEKVTARMSPLCVARDDGCWAEGLFSGPLLRFPVTVNSAELLAVGSQGRVSALRGQGGCEKQVLFSL